MLVDDSAVAPALGLLVVLVFATVGVLSGYVVGALLLV
jgi:hypothetical protein